MAQSIPILTFHAIDDRPSVIAFPPRVFRDGITRLYEAGYRSISLMEAVDCLLQKQPFPYRSYVLTFDDGYQSVYTDAFPTLERYRISATVFIVVGGNGNAGATERLPSMQGRTMLHWSEIKEMQKAGITFGAHTLTHPDLTRLPQHRLEAEVCESKAVVEDALGTSVLSFAYPYGRYDTRSREIVRQHFACACSDKLGLANGSSDRFTLERVDAYYLGTDRLFNLMLTRFFPLYIRGRNIPRRIARAMRSEGTNTLSGVVRYTPLTRE